MSKFKILSGDFLYGSGILKNETLHIETNLYPWPGLTLKVSELSDISIISEQYTANQTAAIMLGVAGALALGPVGAVTGLAVAQTESEVVFIAKLQDGRSFLGVTTADVFREMGAGVARQKMLQAIRNARTD